VFIWLAEKLFKLCINCDKDPIFICAKKVSGRALPLQDQALFDYLYPNHEA
jgi:hypothetical protein